MADNAENKPMLAGVNAALAQVAASGASAEELNGIRRFIAEFLTIGQHDKEPLKFPAKRLDVLDQHPDEITEEKT